jgi:hypothetical protein
MAGNLGERQFVPDGGRAAIRTGVVALTRILDPLSFPDAALHQSLKPGPSPCNLSFYGTV